MAKYTVLCRQRKHWRLGLLCPSNESEQVLPWEWWFYLERVTGATAPLHHPRKVIRPSGELLWKSQIHLPWNHSNLLGLSSLLPYREDLTPRTWGQKEWKLIQKSNTFFLFFWTQTMYVINTRNICVIKIQTHQSEISNIQLLAFENK